MESFWADAPMVYSYTRQQALEDGVLRDAGTMPQEAGIRCPVALSAAAWAAYVTVPEGMEGLQDEKGRLWDILWMFRIATRRAGGQSCIRFQFHAFTDKSQRNPPLHELKAVIGPGDTPEAVITIMMPEED